MREDVVYNSTRAYQASRRVDEAIGARKILLDPRYRLDHTDTARKAPYQLGGPLMAAPSPPRTGV